MQNKYGAQRALQRNGELVSRNLMVGVQLLDARMRTAKHTSKTSDSSAATSRLQIQPLRPQSVSTINGQVQSDSQADKRIVVAMLDGGFV